MRTMFPELIAEDIKRINLARQLGEAKAMLTT